MSQYGMFNPSTDAKGEEGQPKKPARREPGRGMMDGIRKDIKVGRWRRCRLPAPCSLQPHCCMCSPAPAAPHLTQDTDSQGAAVAHCACKLAAAGLNWLLLG